MKIAFIGTFNPVSMGHLLMAQTTVNQIDNNGLIFVPVSDLYKKDELTTKAVYRCEMIRIAIKDNPQFSVSTTEMEFAKDKQLQPRTIETLYILQQTYQEEIAMLIGMDNFMDLHNWFKAEEMVQQFKMIVYPRLGFHPDCNEQELYRKYPQQFIFVNTELTTNISSTEIRQNFKDGKSNRYLIPERVLKYIQAHYYYLDYCIHYKEK